MKIKRLLLIGLILVAVAASLSVVSADSSNVGGIDFNIPDGFSENKSLEQNGVNSTYNNEIPVTASMKGFTKDNDVIAIVVMEFNSSDDVKKVQNDLKQEVNTTKTINGKEGIYENDETGSVSFAYVQDKNLVMIATTDGSLLESIVPK